MIRSFYTLSALVFVAAAVVSCNTPTCGPGTKQVQAANGDLQCKPTEDPAAEITCDVDGGNAEIVAGKCVSHIKCDPDTTMYDPVTGVCVGTGKGNGGCMACPNPVPAGQICVTGGVVDFQTNQHVPTDGTSRPLRIGIYEPIAFLTDPNATPLAEEPATTKGCYTFVVGAPGTGLVALAVQDPVGSAMTPPLTLGGSGAPIVPGAKYNLDGYMVLQSTMDGYAAVNADFKAKGTFVGCFYNQAPNAPTNLLFTETNPAMGVHLIEGGTMPASAKYLKPDGSIDSALTATGTRGCGISSANGITTYTGMGGPATTWQSAPSGSAANVVFVSRFHSCDGQPSGGGCP